MKTLAATGVLFGVIVPAYADMQPPPPPPPPDEVSLISWFLLGAIFVVVPVTIALAGKRLSRHRR